MWLPEPTFVGSYSTQQLPAGSAPSTWLNVHAVALKVPSGLGAKLTVPFGVDGVPSVSLSVTVAVHLAGCETTTPEPQCTDSVVTREPTASACEHATSEQPTARTATARSARPLPSRRGRHSPSRTTRPPRMTTIVNPGFTRLSRQSELCWVSLAR